jgi:ABC-type xylose transport system permease subunit
VGWRERAGPQRFQTKRKEKHMLYTIAVVLIVLWLLGIVTSHAMGGVIHVLLVIALVMVLANFISGRRRST